MITNIDFSEKWLQIERGLASLNVLSFMHGVESKELSRSGEYLISKLEKIGNIDEVIEFLKGEDFYHLSFVFKSPEITIFKSDTVRSVPLFYTFNDNNVYISDQNNPGDNRVIDKDSIIEMVETGHVSEDRTVYKNIFGVQAAEIIVIKDRKIKKDRFFKYDAARAGEDNNKAGAYELALKLDHIFNKIFQEIIDSVPDEGRVVVPLSGGHDSRMVVNYLYKLGFNKVLCYTYGIPGNIQSEISKQVAEALGYEWHFIEYTDEKWEEVHQNGDFDDFIKYAFNGVSAPNLQDFLAVYELKKNGILKSDDVFIQGHGLDILCDFTERLTDETDIIEEAVKSFRWSQRISIDNNNIIYKRHAEIFKSSGVSDVSFLDYLYWQERAAKFLVNSLSVYKFYGYSTRIPFWDIRLINFWSDIGWEQKRSRELLIKMEKKGLLVKQIREIPHASRQVVDKKIKKNAMDYIPNYLKVLYLRISKRKQPQDVGLNLAFNKKINSVSEVIDSPDKWPGEIIDSLGSDLKRYPFQINNHFLTRLYTINKLLEKG